MLVGVPLVAPQFWVTLGNYIGLYSIVALGLVLLTGVAGQTSFGQAAFVGIGAYTTAILSTQYAMSPWINLWAGLALTLALALFLGLITLRMKGHYLPLATIAWGISLYFLFGTLEFLGGHTGLTGIPALNLFGIELRNERYFYFLIWGIALAALWATSNLLDSRPGRAIRALRGQLEMAEAFGVNGARLKIIVFVYAALLASISGWLYAHLQRFVNPTPFGPNPGIEYLFMAVVGGAGSVWGAVVGATLVTLAKQVLQDILPALLGKSGNFEIVVFGILMIVLLQRAREGVWPWIAHLLPQSAPPPVPDAAPLPSRARQAPAGPLLEVRMARKQFGGLVAVNDLSFAIQPGEILGLIGPNGAGKSTMFNLISGALALTAGDVVFRGESIVGCLPFEIARRGIGRTFQHVKLVPRMTRARQRRAGRLPARQRGRLRRRAQARSGRGSAHAGGGRPCDRARGPPAAPPRPGRQPAARQAADRRDRPRARGRPGAVAAGRARRGSAVPGKAGARGAAAPIERRGRDGAPGRARHGLRHGPRRPAGRHGIRPEAGRRAAGRHPAESGRARGLPRRGRVMTAGASDTLLEARKLHVAYGKVEAVRDISLKVERGTIVSVIGPNGAGKTTLLAALMGLLPAKGDLTYLGARADALTVEQRVARGLILVPERRELFAAMSVADNLELGGFQRARSGERGWRNTQDEVYQRFPRLQERRDQLAGTLSGGERQMLAMGRALMGKPKLLMLDEPSLGLAPLMVREIFSIVADLRSTGVSILLVEQNARAALQISDYGYVLETGDLALEGPSAELAANPRVAATYLGKKVAGVR